MDEVDFDDQIEEEYVEDTSYQACYILKAGGKRDPGPIERPAKKRKLNGTTTTSHTFPKLSVHYDSDSLALRRSDRFDRFWQRQKLNFTRHSLDRNTLAQLSDFLNDAPVATYRARLRTALLLTGLDGANYGAVLRSLSIDSANSHDSVLVDLQTQQCPSLQTALKNLIKGIIVEHSGLDTYNKFLAKHKRLLPLTFDLEILELFVSDCAITHVIVSLSNVETFDSHVTNELIHTLHLWQRRIPFTLMLGITSTRELFEHRISKSCLKCLEACAFSFLPKQDLCSDLVRQAQDFDENSTRIYLGSTILSNLKDVNQGQGRSIQSLENSLQYLYMSHFFANPLAILAEVDTSSFDKQEAKQTARVIRNTDSFRLFCENLLAENNKAATTKVRRLLNDDTALLKEAEERIVEGQVAYDTSQRVISGFADLCHLLLNEDSKRPRSKLEIEVQLHQAIHDLTDTDVYDEAVERMQDLLPSIIASLLKRLDPQIVEVLGLNEVMDTLRAESMPEQSTNSHANGETEESHAETNGEAPVGSRLSTPKKRARNAKTTAPGSKPSKTPAGKESSAKADLLEVLQQKLRTSSLDISGLLLHEAYVLSARAVRFKPSFEPQPRAAVERALLRPNDYLGWHQGQEGNDTDESDAENENESSNQKRRTMPAASVMFTLLQEAPSIINVRDLFDAFRSRLEPVQETNGTAAEDDEDVDLRATMTQFYRVLSELKMMGLVKSSTGTQVKRATKGKGARLATQDIDFVAKTSWAGL